MAKKLSYKSKKQKHTMSIGAPQPKQPKKIYKNKKKKRDQKCSATNI